VPHWKWGQFSLMLFLTIFAIPLDYSVFTILRFLV